MQVCVPLEMLVLDPSFVCVLRLLPTYSTGKVWNCMDFNYLSNCSTIPLFGWFGTKFCLCSICQFNGFFSFRNQIIKLLEEQIKLCIFALCFVSYAGVDIRVGLTLLSLIMMGCEVPYQIQCFELYAYVFHT